ncbi:hypothetical protein YB2330_000922 [Saitoella coloradoensis]
MTTGTIPKTQPTTYTRRDKFNKPLSTIKVFEPLPAPPNKDVLQATHKATIDILDPTGERRKMFDRNNRDRIRPGAVLMVESYNQLPNKRNTSTFAGQLMAICRKGPDTSFRLRNHVLRTGVEIRYSLYSPAIKEIRVLAHRTHKKARRAKLFYLRQPRYATKLVDKLVKQDREAKEQAILTEKRKAAMARHGH